MRLGSGERGSGALCAAISVGAAAPARHLGGALLALGLASACGGAASGTLSAVAPGAGPPEPSWAAAVREVVEVARETSRAYEHVESLTDGAGPRLAGSPGDRLAVAWALAYLTDLGFARVRAEPVTVPVWIRGEERVEVLEPVPHRLAAAALGGSVGTPAGGIEAEVVRVGSLEELREAPRDRIEGRIVFVDRRMERTRDGHGYGDAVPVRGGSASAAARLGAVAVIIRSIGTDDTRFPHTGAMHYDDGVPRIPAAAISNPDADVLARWLAAGRTVRIRVELGCRDGGEAESANVIGEVPGTVRPEEIVLLGAHLDSWDLGRGAVDDGAGVAIVIEAARQIAAARERPRRTVRVVLFANEENGGAGARAYAAAHDAELERHVLAIEADFGDGRAWALRTPARDARWARIARLVQPLGVSWEEGEPHGGADLRPLRERGVPIADVVQDGTRYFDLHHTANDVLSQIDRGSLDHAMSAVLAVAYAAALDPELGPRGDAPSP